MKRNLSDYLAAMRTDDVLEATQQAKVQARTLLEDQGITLLALLFADLLADRLGNDAFSVLSPIQTKTAVPA